MRERLARVPQTTAARELEWSATKLLRMERGEGWWHDYASIPSWFELYIGLEEAASALRQYHTCFVPGVLQTREYATAVFSMNQDEVPAEEVERRVEVRMRRARLLTRLEPYLPRFDILLDEAILRRPIGGAQIMAGQLRRLAQASELPNVSIRVLPFSAGLHAGLMAHGSFIVLDFPEKYEPTTVYVEGLTGALFLDRPDERDSYAWSFSGVGDLAMDEQRSRDLLWRTAREYDGDRL
ncbi:DUF5753 domain-containing protein [Solwaraspora sp. WMMD792]|uniref:DUF5753 domain-containing protein n=1 Tax=Solwaraspora sp. WMMD792 TaxID=3016099 RepID=UPI0024173941|nr:DUF5753 domain-containing protein [Solwaraspora sp. WMMD792]MDG4774712.1 DUF5753 domain-containing protein [Solwaraspora sp. WMMD792]